MLDLKENSLRQHLQLLANPAGSAHEEAVRKVGGSTSPETTEETDPLSIPALPTPGPGMGVESPEESSLVSEEQLESLLPTEGQLLTQQLYSVQCSRMVLAHAVPGTLVFTRTSLAFTADDSTKEYEKALCMVGVVTVEPINKGHLRDQSFCPL